MMMIHIAFALKRNTHITKCSIYRYNTCGGYTMLYGTTASPLLLPRRLQSLLAMLQFFVTVRLIWIWFFHLPSLLDTHLRLYSSRCALRLAPAIRIWYESQRSWSSVMSMDFPKGEDSHPFLCIGTIFCFLYYISIGSSAFQVLEERRSSSVRRSIPARYLSAYGDGTNRMMGLADGLLRMCVLHLILASFVQSEILCNN